MFSRTILITIAFASVATRPISPAATGKDVNAAIDRAVAYLRGVQNPDGSWPYSRREYLAGATALAAFTLVTAGVSPDDPAVTEAVGYCMGKRFSQTYTTALTAMLLAAVDADTYRAKITEAARWLEEAQRRGGWA